MNLVEGRAVKRPNTQSRKTLGRQSPNKKEEKKKVVLAHTHSHTLVVKL
jgi:hypothetical protein